MKYCKKGKHRGSGYGSVGVPDSIAGVTVRRDLEYILRDTGRIWDAWAAIPPAGIPLMVRRLEV